MTKFIMRLTIGLMFLITFIVPNVAKASDELVYLKAISVTDGKDIFGKDRYNELKKELDASKITRETYPGGVTIYVAHKGSRKGLLSDDLKHVPLTFKKDLSDIYAYKFGVTQYNGKTYVYGASLQTNAPGLMRLDGSKVMPEACVGPLYGFTVSDGRFDIIYGADNNGVNAWNTEWGDVIGVGQNLDYSLPMPEQITTLDGGINIYHRTAPYVFTYENSNGGNSITIFDPDMPQGKRAQTGTNVTLIPGNGYFAMSKNKITVSTRKIPRLNSDGTTSEYDEVVIATSSSYNFSLYDSNAEKIVENVNRAVISYPDEVIYYYAPVSYRPEGGKYVRQIVRKGVIDLHDTSSKVPAFFNEVFADRDSMGHLNPKVKTDYFADIVNYDFALTNAYKEFNDTITDFERAYSCAYGINDKVVAATEASKLIKELTEEIKSGSISEKHLKMHTVLTAIKAEKILEQQNKFIDAVYSGNENYVNHVRIDIKNQTKAGQRIYGATAAQPIIEDIGQINEYLRNATPADSLILVPTVNYLNDVLAIVNHNVDVAVPEAMLEYDKYLAHKIELKRQAEAERQAELDRQRNERIAMAFISALGNIASSSFSGSKSTSKSSYSSSKSGGSSSSSSSSNNDEKRDRIAWLKREIIELENKVKREKARFEEAARIDASQNTRESHRAMESIKSSYEDVSNQLNQYRAELDALKR